MLSITLRTLVLVSALYVASTGFFAWRWPARWRLPVRPTGTINQRGEPPSPRADDFTRTPPSVGWWLVIGLMALLFGAWLLLVLL